MSAAPDDGLSALEASLARAVAQRAALDWACARIAAREGDVLELGLGNGRTYDHIRQRLPERRIHVIERSLAPHPSCTPPEALLFVGEATDGLARLAGARLALIHADLGRPGRIGPLAGALEDALDREGGLLVASEALPEETGLRKLPVEALGPLSPGQRARIHLYERAP